MSSTSAGLPEQRPDAWRSCTACGAPAPAGRFCSRCGATLSGGSSDAAPTVALPTQAAPADEHPTVVLPRVGSPAPALDDGVVPWDEVADHGPVDLRVGPSPAASHDVLVEGPPRPTSRGRLAVAAAGLVVTAGLVVGAVLALQYTRDGDVRAALDSSEQAFTPVVTDLLRATDAAAVATAVSSADDAADELERGLDRLGPVDGPREASVRDQLTSEQAVLRALHELRQVEQEPMTTWAAAHGRLTSALEQEADSRRELARHDADAARGLPDTAALGDTVTAAVGPALVTEATDEAVRVLQRLQAARTTADLRSLGGSVAAEVSAVAAAADAVPAGEDERVLRGYGEGLEALAALAAFDAERTETWSRTRGELARSFGVVAAGARQTDGADVGAAVTTALAAADGVVGRAGAAITDWKARTAAVIASREADTAALRTYTASFRAQATTYEQLREDLAAFTARVEDVSTPVTYVEGYTFLSQAMQERTDVRDTMLGTSVPPGMQDAHSAVVSAVDRAVSAVQSAYDGLEQSEDCFYECTYYRDTTGWQRFQSESDAITRAYTTAMARWDSSASATAAAVANRPLPPRPAV